MDRLSSQLQRKRPFKRRASDFDLEQVREHASSGIREFLTDPAPQLDPLSILGRKQMGEKPAPDTSGERVLPFPAAERTASQRLPSAPELSAPGFSDPAWGEIDLESPEFRPPRRQPVPKEAHTAQDGHTRGEQTVYSTLWALGRPVARHAKVVVC